MQCPKCKQEVSDNSKFCSNCGTNIKEYLEKMENEKYIKCLNCDKKIEKDAKFCKYCGKKILNKENNNSKDKSIGVRLIHVIIATILLLNFFIVFLFSSPKSQISEIEQTTQPTATIEVLNSHLFNMGYGTQKIEGIVKNNSNETCFNPNVEIYTFDSAGNRVGEYPIPINTLNSGESYKFTIYVNGASRYSVEKCNCGY
ncbi:TPA: hypothetical protein CPT79_08100 [Candidatus Gastranaerophilales bacterium HUM_6]|nr:putative membrane protein [Fusobacterium sp. CAG:815]DAA89361.1 MAG TPA: hypothetical protein CPT79_08100 [Candidatus Gastranaerophilales bacterium HUM_6]DAA93816.1 MAG TPA: hypothetical protein CPT93_05070 [Candidatus Gastranaerophilales bacterium HUM_7]DAB02436.1 MAG TPA: hypothetical protein CPT84_05840 [Candidatus Gastranaerophilales bacterium HUM_12]DAB07361.1 MAG TPA: hypothetical protein CPT78_03955 [Candidatus Gastranaerophilales bacterium HUM_14]